MDIVLGPSESRKTVSVSVGDTAHIELPENPTTGYRWDVDPIDTDLLVIMASDYHPPPSPVPGSGGTRVVVVEARQPGTGHLRLKRWRPWLGPASITGQIEYIFQIAAPNQPQLPRA